MAISEQGMATFRLMQKPIPETYQECAGCRGPMNTATAMHHVGVIYVHMRDTEARGLQDHASVNIDAYTCRACGFTATFTQNRPSFES